MISGRDISRKKHYRKGLPIHTSMYVLTFINFSCIPKIDVKSGTKKTAWYPKNIKKPWPWPKDFLKEMGISYVKRLAASKAPWPSWQFQQDQVRVVRGVLMCWCGGKVDGHSWEFTVSPFFAREVFIIFSLQVHEAKKVVQDWSAWGFEPMKHFALGFGDHLWGWFHHFFGTPKIFKDLESMVKHHLQVSRFECPTSERCSPVQP